MEVGACRLAGAGLRTPLMRFKSGVGLGYRLEKFGPMKPGTMR